MSDTVRVTFLYAVHQQVRYADSPQAYTIISRTYTERDIMGPFITYRLERQGIPRALAYEPDLLPIEEASP